MEKNLSFRMKLDRHISEKSGWTITRFGATRSTTPNPSPAVESTVMVASYQRCCKISPTRAAIAGFAQINAIFMAPPRPTPLSLEARGEIARGFGVKFGANLVKEALTRRGRAASYCVVTL